MSATEDVNGRTSSARISSEIRPTSMAAYYGASGHDQSDRTSLVRVTGRPVSTTRRLIASSLDAMGRTEIAEHRRRAHTRVWLRPSGLTRYHSAVSRAFRPALRVGWKSSRSRQRTVGHRVRRDA